MRKRVAITAAGIGAVAVVAGGGVAIAGSGDDGAASHAYTQDQAAAAKKAALRATGGGTVNSVESDHEDGATVDVRLDEHYAVVVIEGDGEG